MGWTEERVQRLKSLWRDGLSASQIARDLGGVTRNAVIGKVHRLGLSGRAEPARPRRCAPPAPRRERRLPRSALARAPVPRVVRAVQPPVLTLEILDGTATALTLGAAMCRWPIGDPRDPDFAFCGRTSTETGPYCAAHAAVAYQPRASAGPDLVRSLRRYLAS